MITNDLYYYEGNVVRRMALRCLARQAACLQEESSKGSDSSSRQNQTVACRARQRSAILLGNDYFFSKSACKQLKVRRCLVACINRPRAPISFPRFTNVYPFLEKRNHYFCSVTKTAGAATNPEHLLNSALRTSSSTDPLSLLETARVTITTGADLPSTMGDAPKKSRKDLKRTSADSSSSSSHVPKRTSADCSSSSSHVPKKSKTEVCASDGDLDFVQRIHKRRTDVCRSVDEFKFNKKRVRVLSDAEDFADDGKGVVYWMSRDQRVQDNWAFLYAQRLALKLELPLHVCFCLVPKFLDATIRQFGFMLKGLAEVEKECRELDISFHLLRGEAKTILPSFIKEHNIGGVVTDFSPLRTPTRWVQEIKEKLPSDVPFCQVDAHNIVPCWEASPKLEYSARTIRSKIHKVLASYLTEFPPVTKHPHKAKERPDPVEWEAALKFLEVDRSVGEVAWATPGTTAALATLQAFCTQGLRHFASDRNNPNKAAVSNLSPWIHFGQISVQRCIVSVKQYQSRSKEGADAFIEEAIIRRELADNFCFYNPDHYDSIKGAYKWAQDSLEAHKGDKRSHIYSRQQLEGAKTHDDLWNAAQIQMVREGKMHGFLRMYWAKKILEWTPSPEDALKEAIYLNDKYNLDGRDPNGYVGCMWSVCGIHDQGWAERPVFGKIRYMNYQGCKRKFDVPAFVNKYRRNK